MKKLFSLLAMAMLVLSVLPSIFAVSVGSGVGIDVSTEEFPPELWMCDERVVYDDAVESGRNTESGDPLLERINNYAFEGEQIHWTVLAFDKNKIEQITEVVATIGDVQGTGNDIEVECIRTTNHVQPFEDCEARILEEELNTFDPNTMAVYDCTFTVETPDSMDGEFWITVEAIGADGQSVTMDENEFWFLNPVIALSIDGDLEFEDVRPGSVAYSSTLLVGNDAEDGSGVLLDMFISGTDFYDSSSSDARCPVTNQLKLSRNIRDDSDLGHDLLSSPTGHTNTSCNAGTTGLTAAADADHLCYYAVNGAYNTCNGDGAEDNADGECYRPIVYGDSFTRDFYNDAEIIANNALVISGIQYDGGNVLSPGSELSITFKLGLPEPCIGDFDTGDIFFWGEAV